MADSSPFSGQTDRRGYTAEWRSKRDVRGLHDPAQDPESAAAGGRHAPGAASGGARVYFGRVVDAVAYTQCYRVALEQGHPPTICTLGAHTGLSQFGARQANSLTLGSMVLVALHPQELHGVILAVVPGHATTPTLSLSDQIHQASRCGLRVEGTHKAVFDLRNRGHVVDWSAGRPWDGTVAGEWGAQCETGMRVLLDSYMAQIGADELTGLTVFYHDQLTRLGGQNLQVITGGSEEETLRDQGEMRVYRGSTPYPWEHAGAMSPGTDPFRDLEYKAAQIDEPHYSMVEPKTDDQQSFHRLVTLGGYDGQGGKRLVLLPTPEELYRYGDGPCPQAVFEEQLSLSGRYSIRSAKAIYIGKRIAIPGPRRVRRAEDPKGDTEKNYKFAGRDGEGQEHKIVGQVASSGPDPHLQQAAAAADTHAFALNWEGEHPLHYHAKDWKLDQESATPFATNQAPISFAELAGACYLRRPDARKAKVDHRYGEVDYFPNESCISLLDDGGVLISDGYGSELRMSGGHVTITAPGDVWLKAGRNVNCWAGHDLIGRAKNSADLSATKGDLRLKAEKNVQVLAGNDGSGGSAGAILLESRAPSSYEYEGKTGEDVVSGGIQLKAKRGDVVAWAQNIYLRTGGGDVVDGIISLDAAKGTQPIYTSSSDFMRYVTSTCVDTFGEPGTCQSVNLFMATENLLGGGLIVGGYTEITAGGLSVQGNVEIAGGHVFSEMAETYKYEVPKIDGLPLDELMRAMAEGIEAESSIKKQMDKYWAQAFDKFFYAVKRPGNDALIRAAGFSYRKQEHYRTADWRIQEDRWQQFARLAGGAPAAWTESPVVANSERTYPYPGRQKWSKEATLMLQGLGLYDQAAGVSKNRDPGLYGEPKFQAPTPVTPDGSYAVII